MQLDPFPPILISLQRNRQRGRDARFGRRTRLRGHPGSGAQDRIGVFLRPRRGFSLTRATLFATDSVQKTDRPGQFEFQSE